jgi:hypothetical protein
LKRKFLENKVKKTAVQRFRRQKIKNKLSVSVLKLRNFNLMNCVLLGVLTRLYLDDVALEANILLLILLEQPTLTNTIAH